MRLPDLLGNLYRLLSHSFNNSILARPISDSETVDRGWLLHRRLGAPSPFSSRSRIRYLRDCLCVGAVTTGDSLLPNSTIDGMLGVGRSRDNVAALAIVSLRTRFLRLGAHL
jgi:hypothetical protein